MFINFLFSKKIIQSRTGSLNSFLKNTQGALIVEGAFVFLAMAMIIALVVDLGGAFVYQSRLERATYSAASVFRERVALYGDTLENNSNAPVTQAEVDQLRKIVSQLLSEEDISVMVEEVQFEPEFLEVKRNGSWPDFDPKILSGYPKKFVSGKECQSILPALNKKSLDKLPVYSSRYRWLPLYRVTVCFPGKTSWFQQIVNSSAGATDLTVNEFMSFNVVIPR